MDKEIVIRKYYEKLFTLPNLKKLILYNYSLAILSASIRSLVRGYFTEIMSIILRYILGVTVFMLLIYLSIGLFNKVVGFRRSVGIAVFTQAFFFITEIFVPLNIHGFYYLISSGFLLIIATSVSNSVIRIFVTSFLPSFGAFTTMNYPYIQITLSTLIAFSISLLLGLIYLIIIDIISRKYSIKPLQLLRGFLNAWVVNNPRELEKVFSSQPEYDDVDVSIILFKRVNSKDIAFIFPLVHYGPFRTVGSSAFIYMLENELSPRYTVFSFHTVGSHERNIVSSDLSKDLVSKIAYTLRNSSGIRVLPMQPIRVKHCDWSFFLLPFSNVKVILTHNEVLGNDDLPYDILKELNEKYGKKYHIIVVDSHSAKGPKETEVSMLISGLSKAMECKNLKICKEFQIGYGESYVDGQCNGLCRNIVKSVTIRCNSDIYGLIYVYGNNMDVMYRRKLSQILKEMFKLADVEIVTPDDHTCAATTRDVPYSIITECESLTKAIKTSVNESLKNLKKASVIFKRLLIKNVPLMGTYVWKIINALESVGGNFIKAFYIFMGLMNFSTLLITYLIH